MREYCLTVRWRNANNEPVDQHERYHAPDDVAAVRNGMDIIACLKENMMANLCKSLDVAFNIEVNSDNAITRRYIVRGSI